MTWLLIGAGGHAKAIIEALSAAGRAIDTYVDPIHADWLDATHITDDEQALGLDPGNAVLGLGRTQPHALQSRLALFRRYRDRGWAMPAVVHPGACVSGRATLADGAIVLAGAVVQPDAVLEEAALVNTGAVVEHDSTVEAGAHIAPRAIVLGGCKVGSVAMVGAGAVILPATEVAGASLVPALTRHPE